MTASAPTERQLEVAIFAARTTDKAAAEYFGMPRRTVTNIRNRWQDTPEFRIARAKLALRLADQYADMEQRAIDRANQALADPKTPARDIARLLEVSAQNRALTTGDVTARTETTVSTGTELTWEEKDQLARFIDAVEAASDDELRQWAADGGLAALRYGEREATRILAERQERQP